jgi:glucosamine-6-phosphate deaminase
MQISKCQSKDELGAAAAARGAAAIRKSVSDAGAATIVVATGASQFEMLGHLVGAADIDWARVTVFHLDEYIGLAAHHQASFRRFLRERFVQQLPVPLAAFHEVAGDSVDAAAECARLGALISPRQVDVAFIGVGENGHLAFNDPPADFETEVPYLVVELDLACRQQQLGEGWFPSLDDVPKQAISMSIKEVVRATTLIVSVPDARKAAAVKCTVEGPVDNACPASILQRHADARLFLDADSAAQLASS